MPPCPAIPWWAESHHGTCIQCQFGRECSAGWLTGPEMQAWWPVIDFWRTINLLDQKETSKYDNNVEHVSDAHPVHQSQAILQCVHIGLQVWHPEWTISHNTKHDEILVLYNHPIRILHYSRILFVGVCHSAKVLVPGGVGTSAKQITFWI